MVIKIWKRNILHHLKVCHLLVTGWSCKKLLLPIFYFLNVFDPNAFFCSTSGSYWCLRFISKCQGPGTWSVVLTLIFTYGVILSRGFLPQFTHLVNGDNPLTQLITQCFSAHKMLSLNHHYFQKLEIVY